MKPPSADPATAAGDHLRRAVLFAHRTDFRRARRLCFVFGFVAGVITGAFLVVAALLWFAADLAMR